MKNGLIEEHGHLVYYKNDRLYHAGVIQVDGDIYYISSKGRAVKGVHIVHGEMANGILKRGTYTFGEDYKLIKGSYVPPRKKKKNYWEKLKKFIPVAGLVLAAVLILAVATSLSRSNIRSQTAQSGDSQNLLTIRQDTTLPTHTEKVLLTSLAAKEVYDGLISVEEGVEQGVGYRPFVFEYDLDNVDGTMTLWERDDPTQIRMVDLPQEYTSVSIDNLKTDTAYEYKIDTENEEFTGAFETDKSTRFLSISGLSNVRDIGGYTTMDGKTVKQGVLIRGSELDGLMVPSFFLNKDQVDDVQDIFGFVYEMDLRGGSIYTGTYQSRLGENVGHKFYGAPQYGDTFQKTYLPALRDIFTDLADPGKYPMYMHCTYGADRTGTIIFLLQGLLNMSEEDMIREFRLTGFTTPSYAVSEKMDIIIHNLEGYEGDTLQEKIVSFLTQSVGITEEQIQSIRNILLE